MTTAKLTAAVLVLSSVGWATDAKSLLLGIGIGLGLYGAQTTRQYVVMPVVHKIQRVIRPIPQDKIDKERRRAEKAARKARK